jgi:uncharacterized membrane protein
MTSVAAAATPAEAPAPLVPRRPRALALGCALALVALGLAWELWLAPIGRGTLALKVVPLLLPLPGLWRGRLYTFRWTSLLVWLYFTEGVVRAMGDGGVSAALAAVEVGLSLALFAACAWAVRACTAPRARAARHRSRTAKEKRR